MEIDMASDHFERAIYGEIVVNANRDEVWEAWTTEAGVKSFFAPGCNLDLKPDSLYEIFFNPSAKPGERGGEGLRIMAIQPKQMFSFTWNAPPNLPEVRNQRTHVIVRLYELDLGQTRVTLYHDGWGNGGEWDKAFEYFERAWKRIVLPRLRYRFEHGPIDWDNPPDL
jgi:uncharacterized protein YndB with AHSA1/START domain